MTVIHVPDASPHAKHNIEITINYDLYLYINATGAVHSAGSWTLLFLFLFAALTFGTDEPACRDTTSRDTTSREPVSTSTPYASASSSASCAADLRLRPRLPVPLSAAALSLAARATRALSRSS
jgi:hypothetical protein